jgi:hypothetical protein
MTGSDLTAIALTGVVHSPNVPLTTGAPVDTLPLPGEDRGRDLLLRAGGAAVYRLAGRVAARAVAAPEPAPDETRPACSPEAAALIEILLTRGEHQDLLPEALERLARAALILPPALIPLALDGVPHASKNALAPLTGERGRWLARHNKEWLWVEANAEVDTSLPPDAETVWQEGSIARRVALLASLRATDPARAREWLSGVWKQEKAETRASMLETFWTGLASGDEQLLESALSDRAERVRTVAAQLLTALPGSALAGRIRERADVALTYAGSALDAKPPAATDDAWARDGLSTQAIAQKTGQRAFWLLQILERVPPSHWVERFGKSPADLIVATVESKWRIAILQGWSAATDRFQDRAWAEPLWDIWLTLPNKAVTQTNADLASALTPLSTLIPPAALEVFALHMLAEPESHPGLELYEALDWLPRPWSQAVARAYLDGLRAFVAATKPNARNLEPWDDTLDTAALALPEALFAEARQPLSVADADKHWQMTRFNNLLTTFAETIQMRERIVKVIPA